MPFDHRELHKGKKPKTQEAEPYSGDDRLCKICYEPLEDRRVIRLKCTVAICRENEGSNIFHETCLTKWKVETGKNKGQVIGFPCPRDCRTPAIHCHGFVVGWKDCPNPHYVKRPASLPVQPDSSTREEEEEEEEGEEETSEGEAELQRESSKGSGKGASDNGGAGASSSSATGAPSKGADKASSSASTGKEGAKPPPAKPAAKAGPAGGTPALNIGGASNQARATAKLQSKNLDLFSPFARPSSLDTKGPQATVPYQPKVLVKAVPPSPALTPWRPDDDKPSKGKQPQPKDEEEEGSQPVQGPDSPGQGWRVVGESSHHSNLAGALSGPGRGGPAPAKPPPQYNAWGSQGQASASGTGTPPATSSDPPTPAPALPPPDMASEGLWPSLSAVAKGAKGKATAPSNIPAQAPAPSGSKPKEKAQEEDKAGGEQGGGQATGHANSGAAVASGQGHPAPAPAPAPTPAVVVGSPARSDPAPYLRISEDGSELSATSSTTEAVHVWPPHPQGKGQTAKNAAPLQPNAPKGPAPVITTPTVPLPLPSAVTAAPPAPPVPVPVPVAAPVAVAVPQAAPAPAPPSPAKAAVKRYDPLRDDDEPPQRKYRFYKHVSTCMSQGMSQAEAVRAAVDRMELEDIDEEIARRMQQMAADRPQATAAVAAPTTAAAAVRPDRAAAPESVPAAAAAPTTPTQSAAQPAILTPPPVIVEQVSQVGAYFASLVQTAEGSQELTGQIADVWKSFQQQWNQVMTSPPFVEYYRSRPDELEAALRALLDRVRQELLALVPQVTAHFQRRAQEQLNALAVAPAPAPAAPAPVAPVPATPSSTAPAPPVSEPPGPPAGLPYARTVRLCKVCWERPSAFTTSTCFHKGPCVECEAKGGYTRCCHREADGKVCGSEVGVLKRFF